MPFTVLIHMLNEDPILAELEKLPGPQDTSVTIVNPRRKDGKQVNYISPEASQVIFPWTRIAFIETFPGAEEAEVVEFFRE